ncbi:hypothetical protein JIN85_20195 [Luteolibacter pohnpeiensis]|uniref:Uncharacterized protein n=1 Tax=Luteolibacter pohnpeiensis TaxID=454153 RepID=A0A934SBA0_9BACT|nr:hypothetical protein [Luteolibacter pohnpeiensis]MBK1884744.1 hypothetical protein [Luteolibacter pohnpeiensis]
MKQATLLLATALGFLLTGCNENKAPRYDVQPIALAGGLATIFQITDNEQNTVYLYNAEKDHLVLSGKFSLSEVGKAKIQMEKTAESNEQ